MHSSPLPSQADLALRFHYTPDTGHIIRLTGPRSGKRAGSEHFRPNGDRCMRRVDGMNEHRLIWQLVHGSIPEGLVIDHINGDPFDNRLANLRCVTDRQNGLNRKLHRNSSTGVTGVYKTAGGRWRARAVVNGHVVGLSTYDTREEAIAARAEAIAAHGELIRPAPPVPAVESERCPHCGMRPRKLTEAQVLKGRERARKQWLRRKELIARAMAQAPS